jgi:tRNA modification GTPase
MQTASTIFALSTGKLRSALAVIRISGTHASQVRRSLSQVLTLVAKVKTPVVPRKLYNCDITDNETRQIIDRGMFVYFKGPKSFTGEDVVELHLHGGVAVLNKALSCLERIPQFRLAEPGEFSRRAFENNKMDLTEVEGLSDLINAETENQRFVAISQYQVKHSQSRGI